MQANRHAIVDLRRARGYTQAELARQADISKQVLSNLERGRSVHPRPWTLANLAAALNVHLTDITIGEYSNNVHARRALVVAMRADGLSIAQIAAHIGMSQEAVRSHLPSSTSEVIA